ncbi:MAG: hypothetical protein Q7R40_20150 [Phaeospirillum sp.]|nr:hypothetical protein [Phaeospirillum sp.]
MSSISSIAASKFGRPPASPPPTVNTVGRLALLAMVGLLSLLFVAASANLLDMTVSVKGGTIGAYSKGEPFKVTASGKQVPVNMEYFEGKAETFRDLFILFDLGPEAAAANRGIICSLRASGMLRQEEIPSDEDLKELEQKSLVGRTDVKLCLP